MNAQEHNQQVKQAQTRGDGKKVSKLVAVKPPGTDDAPQNKSVGRPQTK